MPAIFSSEKNSVTRNSIKLTTDGSELGIKARSAFIWTGGFRIVQSLLQFALAIVLVRLLTPDEYGSYAVVASIIGFLNAASFETFLAYTVQVRRDDEVHYQDHFTASVVIQLAIFLLTNLVAIGLRFVPQYASVAFYIHVLSPILLFGCIGSFRVRMLERELDWRRMRVQMGLGVLASAITALTLALSGAGIYALLISPQVKYLPSVLDLLLVARWRPTWAWSWERYRPAWQFGLNRVASAFVAKGRALLESNALALLLGLATLGHFGRAVGLARLACAQLIATVVQSVYPILTKLEPSSVEFARAGGLLLRLVAWTLLPLNAILAVSAAPLVHLLFGDKWLELIPLLPWTMLLAGITGISQCAYHLTLGNQQLQDCLRFDLWGLVGTGTALVLVALGFEIRIYVMALCAVEFLGLFAQLSWLVRARALYSRSIALAILPPLVAIAIALPAAEGVRAATASGTYGAVAFAGHVALFALFYVIALRVLFRASLAELVDRMPARRRFRQLFRLYPPPLPPSDDESQGVNGLA